MSRDGTKETQLLLNRTIKGVSCAFLGMCLRNYAEGLQKPLAQEYRLFESTSGWPTTLQQYERRVFGRTSDDCILHDNGFPYDLFGYSHGSAVAPLPERLPTFQEVYAFVHSLFKRAQIEPECVIAALIYLERVLLVTPGLTMTARTWRRLTFTALMIASKVWDDVSCSSASFALCSHGDFGLASLNQQEAFFLGRLKFRLYLTPDEYRETYYALKHAWLAYSPTGSSNIDFQTLQSWNCPCTWGMKYVFGVDVIPTSAESLASIPALTLAEDCEEEYPQKQDHTTTHSTEVSL